SRWRGCPDADFLERPKAADKTRHLRSSAVAFVVIFLVSSSRSNGTRVAVWARSALSAGAATHTKTRRRRRQPQMNADQRRLFREDGRRRRPTKSPLCVGTPAPAGRHSPAVAFVVFGVVVLTLGSG